MSTKYPSGTVLYHALLAEGFDLPPNCGDIEMELPVDGLIRLKYVENLSGERLAQFGRALQRVANDGQKYGTVNSIVDPAAEAVAELFKLAKK